MPTHQTVIRHTYYRQSASFSQYQKSEQQIHSQAVFCKFYGKFVVIANCITRAKIQMHQMITRPA